MERKKHYKFTRRKKQVKSTGLIYPGEWERGEDVKIFHKMYKRVDKILKLGSEIDYEEVLLEPNKEYTLKIDYPQKNPFSHKFKTSEKGMARQEFANLACECYHNIYEEAEGGIDIPIKRLLIQSLKIYEDDSIALDVKEASR